MGRREERIKGEGREEVRGEGEGRREYRQGKKRRYQAANMSTALVTHTNNIRMDIAYLQLLMSTQQPCSICLQLTTLSHDSKFHREPVYLSVVSWYLVKGLKYSIYNLYTPASLVIHSSDTPKEARPISYGEKEHMHTQVYCINAKYSRLGIHKVVLSQTSPEKTLQSLGHRRGGHGP